ncbi:MAG TPA: hypothetical protein VK272_05515 [Solirubrobacteraceae bacterium]|nr:hypothetical protein [Solirubrobacteraceae bacterium]
MPIAANLTDVDVLSLATGVTSVALAVFAVWLSLYFFRQSGAQARLAKDSADEVARTVERLEKLWAAMYGESVAMMRDTVTDMREHVWRREDLALEAEIRTRAEEVARAKISDARSELLAQISSSVQGAGVEQEHISELLDELQPAVSKALEDSSGAGAERTAQTSFMVATMRAQLQERGPQDLRSLAAGMTTYGFDPSDVVHAARQARADGWLGWDGNPGKLDETTRLFLVTR